MSTKMYQTFKMLLLLSAALQIIVAEASEEQQANLDILPSKQDGQNGFYNQVSRELNDSLLETQGMLDRNELQAQVDYPQCEIEQLQQNQSLWKQAEAEYLVEIIQLNTKLQDNEVNTGKLAVNNSELLQSNLKCIEMNRNTTEESARRRIASYELISKDIDSEKQIKTMAKKNAQLVQVVEKILFQAAENGDVELVRVIINSSMNVNLRDEEKNTPLIKAARNNHKLTVKTLIEFGANLDLQNKYNDTALLWAALNNETEMGKMLLDAGADVNLQTIYGISALFYAAEKYNLELLKMLVEKGAHVNVVEINGETPLFFAATWNNAEAALFLVENGAEVNIASKDGYTPLHIAAGWNGVDVAKVFVQHGAHINVRAEDGKTPLGNALFGNSSEVTTYLNSIGGTE